MKKKDDIIFDNSWLQQCGSREKNDIVRAPYTKKIFMKQYLGLRACPTTSFIFHFLQFLQNQTQNAPTNSLKSKTL